MPLKLSKSVLLVVAHPDDETLWAGGTILSNPSWDCFVICLCRGSDRDRAPRFHKALMALGATGVIDDLDDGPEQTPLGAALIESRIQKLLPSKRYDIIITHSPDGEYTRHLRHEEIGSAVVALWSKGILSTNALWNFAYEDGSRSYYPRAIKKGASIKELQPSVWCQKYAIITKIYGFGIGSWEANTTPKVEAFWKSEKAEDARDLFSL